MSIGVLCEECGKTYQVRDDMAGRKGRCPKGHPILVPALAEPEPEDELVFESGSSPSKAEAGPANDFAFDETPSHSGSPKKKSKSRHGQPADDDDDDSSFHDDEQPAAKSKRRERRSTMEMKLEPEEEIDDRPTKKSKVRDERKSREMKAIPPEAPAGDDFAFVAPSKIDFASDESETKKPAAKKGSKKNDAPPAAPEAEFAFPTESSASKFGTSAKKKKQDEDDEEEEDEDEEEKPAAKTGRYAAKKPGDKPGKTMMPLFVGAALGMLGIGGGVTAFLMGNSKVGPLREEVAALTKRAETAEQQAKTNEAGKVYAEGALADLQKKPPPKDPAAAIANARASIAEKKIKELEGKIAMLEAGPKVDPAMPKGKDDPPMKPKEEPGAPKGGKSWTVSDSLSSDAANYKPGAVYWLFPKEDVGPKPVKGVLKIKIRWELRKGQRLRPESVGTVFFQEAGQVVGIGTLQLNLAGDKGEGEITVNVAKRTGAGKISLAFTDGNVKDQAKLEVFSNFVTMDIQY